MSALEELRENLREAAARDIAVKRARRRRQRRATGLIVAALLGGTAAATAADLISVGEPALDQRDIQANGYRPPPGTLKPEIVARADAKDELPIGLGVYRAKNGLQCLVVGSLRGYTLGRIEDGKFKPYPQNTVGSCGKPGLPLSDSAHYRGRTLVIGAAKPGSRGARVTIEGESHEAPLQKKNTYLFVFRGELDRNTIKVDLIPRSPH